jgi:hypothetical protein
VPFIGDEESRSRLRAILEMVKRSQVDPREVWTDGTPLNVDIPTSVRVLSKAPNGFALVILEKPLRLTRVIPVQKLGALPSTEGGPQRFLLSPTYKKDPAPGSMWLHRPSGTWVQVTKRSGDAIHFRAGENAPVGVLHIDAFIDVHEPINQRDTTPVTGIEIALDEEWSDGADGVACRIVSVDQRSGVVRVAAPSGEIQSVNLIWFTNGRWKRVERRTVYERLLSDFVKED